MIGSSVSKHRQSFYQQHPSCMTKTESLCKFSLHDDIKDLKTSNTVFIAFSSANMEIKTITAYEHTIPTLIKEKQSFSYAL